MPEQREATAVTESLYLGTCLSIPHVYVYGDASQAIKDGAVVRTDSEETCLVTLMNLGKTYQEARYLIDCAKYGLDYAEGGFMYQTRLEAGA